MQARSEAKPHVEIDAFAHGLSSVSALLLPARRWGRRALDLRSEASSCVTIQQETQALRSLPSGLLRKLSPAELRSQMQLSPGDDLNGTLLAASNAGEMLLVSNRKRMQLSCFHPPSHLYISQSRMEVS